MLEAHKTASLAEMERMRSALQRRNQQVDALVRAAEHSAAAVSGGVTGGGDASSSSGGSAGVDPARPPVPSGGGLDALLRGGSDARARPPPPAPAPAVAGGEQAVEELRQQLRRAIVATEDAVEEARSSHNCVICMDAASSVVLLPCRHMCACVVCADKVRRCPLCREPCSDRMQVFA